MSTPAPLAVPPNTPRRIDPEDAFRPKSAALLKIELDARRDDIRHRVEGIRDELTSFRGATAGGRPLPEAITANALLLAGGALAAGLALGALAGARKRRRSAPEISDLDIVRAHAQSLVDAAARRVAKGADPDAAIARSLRSHPIVVADRRTAAERRGPGTVKLVLNTLFGIGLKVASDQLVQRLTPHDGTVDALEDAAD